MKDMLQNGILGHTLLIESGDLRNGKTSPGGGCCLVYNFSKKPPANEYNYKAHIPSGIRHITVYSNSVSLPPSFLRDTGVKSIDLGPLSQVVEEVQRDFLIGCTSLAMLDLSPLSRLTKVHAYFLGECTGLSEIDLSPLSQVVEVEECFLGDALV